MNDDDHPDATPPALDDIRERPIEGERTSGFAVAALIFGVLGFLPLPLIGSVLAIFFGIVARRRIRESAGELGGYALANAGLALGGMGIVVGFFLFLFAVS
ncbi:MAG: DUF4190 domain-containing protein [Actinomycetota bacterium]